MSIECSKCGACCVAPDISSLNKPLGVRCEHLLPDNLCAVYENRPRICRDYAADWLCELIAAPTLPERVDNYLRLFDLRLPKAAVPAGGLAAAAVPRACR
jgi:uncharacterized protein